MTTIHGPHNLAKSFDKIYAKMTAESSVGASAVDSWSPGV